MIPLPPVITELISRFEQNHQAYHSDPYNETQLRREFVDPFFEALGWDVNNKQGYAEAYKDVIHEDAIKVGGVTKAPDYCFRIGGTRKFFIEAKKPSIKIKEDIGAAFQLRRYAWSAKLPLSILTNFEEFAVYDCRIKPDKADKASTGRILYLTIKDYAQHWEEIASIFSHEAVLKGSFDKYAEAGKGKKGTAEVDTAFLKEIESWRELLARNLALRNPDLTQRELNFSVQRIIDRIIFLRICEDRGIEDYNRLLSLVNGTNVYRRLDHFFRLADERYNSGLFHFSLEKGRKEEPDRLTPSLIIDDAPLKEIIKDLYYPDSPYEFSVLPADILGQVYEQFLGKVIRLTAGHRAVVEDKPEVKKAGGVYYTPTYIVDYIVKNTVGKLVTGKTPKQAAKIRILDPACGSGSFLINAYQYLLDWHLDWYQKNTPRKWTTGRSPVLCQGHRGEWKLTTAERKRILLNNIYGVDIDSQAVEVTKLSLLLKVLEGENEQTLSRQLKLFRERALPDLGNNIKCGNSLIGPDYSHGQQMSFIDEEERYKINTFDWKREFEWLMKQGGFDGVIGNPPYIQLSMADYYNKSVNNYLLRNYSSSMGRLNTFGLFIERVLRYLLTKNGFFSFIVPNTLLTQEYYQSVRKEILKHRLDNITIFKFPVFSNAVVETIIFVIQKTLPVQNKVKIVKYDNKSMTFEAYNFEQDFYLTNLHSAISTNVDNKTVILKAKLEKRTNPLNSITNINQAIALKFDRSQSLFKECKGKNYKPVLDGRNIHRYTLNWESTYLAYDIQKIHSCKRTDIFEAKEKILFRRVGDRLIATYDNAHYYALNTLVVITLKEKVKVSLKFLLGLINSNLLNFYYFTFLKSTKKVFSEIQARQLAQLPIRTINFLDSTNKARHDQMVALVEQMLLLHKQLADVKTDQERIVLQRQIDTNDHQIDQLVYDLYGLTEDEISIIDEVIPKNNKGSIKI